MNEAIIVGCKIIIVGALIAAVILLVYGWL